MMWLIAAILLALSLCADCFAVSACSSVTLKDSSWGKVIPVAFVFGVVQAGLFLLGWLFGDLFVGFVGKLAPIIGFLSMDGDSGGDMLLKGMVLFAVTFLTVVAGMKGGSYVGRKYGRPALWTGGTVLILIGLNILFKFI